MEITIIQQKIYEIRGFKVMLDFDLAELYGVETKNLKRAVKRNLKRFPKDFMFELAQDEWENLRCNFGTSSWGGTRYAPYAFTEHGVVMLASIINSDKAVNANIAIVRAFIALREMAMHYKELAQKIAEMEKTRKVVENSLQRLSQSVMSYLNPPSLIKFSPSPGNRPV